MAKTKYIKQEVPEITKQRLNFLGALLREYRWEEGLSRLEVYDQSDIHFRTITRLENGENVSLVTLFRYMDFLNLDLSEIAFADDEM
jgi:transcriptional regulator with XRE-family HTH domain